MGKKGVASVLLVIIGIGVVLTAFFIPGMRSSITSIFEKTSYCKDAPFNPKCVCVEGYNKETFFWTGIPKNFCEKQQLFLNPESSSYNQDAVDYAKQKLREFYPDCNTIECPDNIGVDIVQETSGNRLALVECRNSKVWWEVFADVEDGTVTKSHCINYGEIPVGENWVDLKVSGPTPSSRLVWKYDLSFSSDCIKDNGKVIKTMGSPDNIPIDYWILTTGYSQTYSELDRKWYVVPAGIPDICKISSSTANSATVSCDMGCPTGGRSGMGMQLFAGATREWIDQNYCQVDCDKISSDGFACTRSVSSSGGIVYLSDNTFVKKGETTRVCVAGYTGRFNNYLCGENLQFADLGLVSGSTTTACK